MTGRRRASAGTVLTINGGSSSIRFALFERSDPLRRLLNGRIEGIGGAAPQFEVEGVEPADRFSRTLHATGYAAAAEVLMQWLVQRLAGSTLRGAGHRIVHGGPNFSQPQAITPDMLSALRELSAYDPQHLPQEILLAESFGERFPDVPQVACFDTAFHHAMPRVAQLLPIPRRYLERGLRRYGFHGLSYSFLMEELTRLAGPHAARGRVILAHLGNGASLAAVHKGKSIDTSMGFTPTGGIPMSSRSGDLDPGLVGYLARTERMDVQAWNEMVNFRSGLLGVSETSADMRELLTHEVEDVRAAEAVALFCYQVRKYVGAFAAALGGLDTLVFSGGIGENAPEVRRRICEGLGFLGIELALDRNAANASLISNDENRVAVRVIRTDEESMIAKAVCRFLDEPTEEDKHGDDGQH
jgi:acetate kinase